ncbi:MAG: extracellular solute-binding protein [Firmicutes bacterium]|nr:extracellular solute-binding protein [Bacillota bacterium]
MKHLKTIFLLLLAAVAFTFAACRNNGNDLGSAQQTQNEQAPALPAPGQTDPVAPEGAEPVELTIALWHLTTQPEFQNSLDAWVAMNPHVSFNIIDTTTAAFPEQITTQIAGGTPIDLMFVVNRPFQATLAEAGQLMDLTDHINSWGRAAEYGTALEMNRVGDRYFSAPWRQDFWPLFYNKDIFAEAGEPLPYNLTWQEYHDLAVRLTSGSGLDKVYGTHLHTWNSIIQAMSAAQLGEHMFQTDYSWLTHMYEIRTSLQNLGAMMDIGTIRAANVGYRPRFEDGHAAMIVMGSWYIGELAERATFNWGIAPVPQMPNSPTPGQVRTMGNVTPIAIPVTARHPEEALRFVEWISGEEGALILADLGIPSAFMNDNVMDRFFAMPGMPLDDLSRRAFSPDIVVAEWPLSPLTGAVDQILSEENELIMVGANSIEDGIRNMNERVSRVLAEHGYGDN